MSYKTKKGVSAFAAYKKSQDEGLKSHKSTIAAEISAGAAYRNLVSPSRKRRILMTNEKTGHKKVHQKLKIKKKTKKQLFDKGHHSIGKSGEKVCETEIGSIEEGRKSFEMLIHPNSVQDFLETSFEKKFLHVRRSNSSYYSHLFSTSKFHSILRDQNVIFGKNLDVTSFSHGLRETHTPEGKAYPPVVWDFYTNGCSLRLLNPQGFDKDLWKLLASLQEFTGSFVGANMYLTPPGTQGFAPHYDDVEVFMLQIEGKKRWRLYESLKDSEKLPRYSSHNLNENDLKNTSLLLDVVVEAGDMLYLPRGTIHQGTCFSDSHSLHLSVSCHQIHSYGDLLAQLLPASLEKAMEENIEFRRGLPFDIFQRLGIVNSEKENERRKEILNTIQSLFSKLFTFAPTDSAVDQMAKKYLHDTLPPCISAYESKRTVVDGGEMWIKESNTVGNRVEIEPTTEIRLLRGNCLRIITEENSVRVYYNVENSLEYHEIPPTFFDVEPEMAPSLEFLYHSYPKYVQVAELPSSDDISSLVQILWEKKLIMTKNPLKSLLS